MRFHLLPRYFEKTILKYLIPRNFNVCIIPPLAHTFSCILFVEYWLYIILAIDNALKKYFSYFLSLYKL